MRGAPEDTAAAMVSRTSDPSERGSDRVLSIVLSIAVHALIAGALLWGWWSYRRQPPAPRTLAIQATVVRNPTLHRAPAPARAQPAPAAPPTPPPAPAQPVQQPQAHQQAELAAAAKAAAEEAAAAKLAEEQATARAAQEAAAHAAAVKAQEQAEAQRKARQAAEAALQAKLAAERKAKEEAKQKAEERAKQDAAREAQLLAQQLKAEQAEQQRQADLQQQLQAEEHLDALERGPAETDYVDAIEARIERAWTRPASAQPGVKCIVHLTQIPGGEITHVTVQSCNGDDAVRQSVETAAYRASPLPAPPDPALFQANIIVTFAPDQ